MRLPAPDHNGQGRTGLVQPAHTPQCPKPTAGAEWTRLEEPVSEHTQPGTARGDPERLLLLGLLWNKGNQLFARVPPGSVWPRDTGCGEIGVLVWGAVHWGCLGSS